MAGKKAESTAQRHVLLVRKEIEKLLPNPMDTVSPKVPETDTEWKKLNAIPSQGHGWRYVKKAGHLCIKFEQPILWHDVQQAFYEGLRKGGVTSEDSEFMAKWEDHKKTSGDTGESVGENPKGHKRGDVIVGTTRFLTRTSKMGCYSWNLPAGPPKHDGCCPGSAMAFYVKGLGENVMSGVRMKNAIRNATKYTIGYQSTIPNSVSEIRRRFICNGCYAMKGAYGNPSVITIMQWRAMWLKDFALPTGAFGQAMEQAIRLAQVQSIKERARAKGDPRKLAAIPHPDYFRIHDSGDMFSEQYLQEWINVCKRMKDIHFWAPSRVWTTAAMSRSVQDIITRRLPSNLCLRPSGLFFDGPDPVIPGLAGGTSSSKIEFRTKGKKISLDITATGPDTWGCPAYLPEVIGGGALPTPYRAPKKKEPKANPVRKQAYDVEAYAMYPKVDDATPERKDMMFVKALWDKKTKRFIIDPSTGRPMVSNKDNRKLYPDAEEVRAQSFQAAGSCSVARDPNHAAECRVCWGTTGDKKSKAMKKLPVVYGKH